MEEFHDIMLRPNGKYVCAEWCENGEVEVRGDTCWRCKFDSANYLVKNCAEAYYDAYMEHDADDMLREYALDELFDAVESLRQLRAERKQQIEELAYDMRDAVQEQGSEG